MKLLQSVQNAQRQRGGEPLCLRLFPPPALAQPDPDRRAQTDAHAHACGGGDCRAREGRCGSEYASGARRPGCRAAGEAADPEAASYSALIGRVTGFIPGMGYALLLLSSTVGKLCAMSFALCGFLLMVLGEQLSRARAEQAEAASGQ